MRAARQYELKQGTSAFRSTPLLHRQQRNSDQSVYETSADEHPTEETSAMRKVVAMSFAFGTVFIAASPVSADAQQANRILKRGDHIARQTPLAYPQSDAAPIWICAYIDGQRRCPHDGTLM
jgi:hypothetical protein